VQVNARYGIYAERYITEKGLNQLLGIVIPLIISVLNLAIGVKDGRHEFMNYGRCLA